MNRNIKRIAAIIMLTVLMIVSCTTVISATDNMTPELEAKLQSIIDECKEEVDEDDEYAVAVWLHDWLIYHANYDYTYTEYDTDGVILKGKGTCQSYSYAYSELLGRMGIENKFIRSYSMEHMWNLIKIDGEWCHVDVTWDAPDEGGYEHHGYFGLTDELMGRDHVWEKNEDYPECTSLENFYPKREGYIIIANESDLIDAFEDICSERKTKVAIYSISTDSDLAMHSVFETWFYKNYSTYKLTGFGISYTNVMMTLTLTYSGPNRGDANDDKNVDMKDATLLLQYLADWDVEIDSSQADVNNDGYIDVKDVTLLLQYLAEWDVSI